MRFKVTWRLNGQQDSATFTYWFDALRAQIALDKEGIESNLTAITDLPVKQGTK